MLKGIAKELNIVSLGIDFYYCKAIRRLRFFS